MTPEQEFHELTGGCWHEPIFLGSRICMHCGVLFAVGDANKPFGDFERVNPTYSHADEILLRMKEYLGDVECNNFMATIAISCDLVWKPNILGEIESFEWAIKSKYILNPSALLQKAIEFLKENKK